MCQRLGPQEVLTRGGRTSSGVGGCSGEVHRSQRICPTKDYGTPTLSFFLTSSVREFCLVTCSHHKNGFNMGPKQ